MDEKYAFLSFLILITILSFKTCAASSKRRSPWETNKRFVKNQQKDSFFLNEVSLFDKQKVPTYTRKINLYSRPGQFLAILPNGKLRGTSDRNSPDAVLEMQSFGVKYKRIRRPGSKLFLAINKAGRPYTRRKPNPDTLFLEILDKSGWVRYQNVRNQWMLGLKKNGKLKRKTKLKKKRQRTTQFLLLLRDFW